LAAGYSPCRTLPPTYRINKNGLAAFSCIGRNGLIIYEVEKFNKSSQLLMHIEYPIDEKKYWDKAIEIMVNPFHLVLIKHK
jgi:hypothetical protein